MLQRLSHLPEGFLDCKADQLHTLIPDNTLIELSGTNPEPLFLSVLLHGNETTGLIVAQNILRKYQESGLPRSLLLFIGNTTAASEGKRRLDSQPDFNRIWLEGEVENDCDEHQKIAELLRDMARRPLFASIDIHNNTGINPHYSCINRLTPAWLNLARQFSRLVIYFIRPEGVQSKAFAHLCPSVTLECGKVGDEIGIQLATRYVDEILNADSLSKAEMDEADLDLFHTVAVIKIPENIRFSFTDEDADVCFVPGIESLNFEEIPADTRLASVLQGLENPLLILDEDGNTITDELFTVKDGSLVNLKPLMLSMLTLDENIIRQDCLCYVMERYAVSMGEKPDTSDKPVWTV